MLQSEQWTVYIQSSPHLHKDILLSDEAQSRRQGWKVFPRDHRATSRPLSLRESLRLH